MKKLFLFGAAVFAITFGARAQDRVINFEKDATWAEVLDKAKRQDKIVFVDCYTDWCGPCRKIAAEVFTKNEVADFYNANFVNAKFEMEKSADGLVLGKKYGVAAYPTMIYVDPHTEELLHIIVGGLPGYKWLIEEGRQALDPNLSIPMVVRRYESGNRSPELMKNYLELLGNTNKNEEQKRVKTEYLNSLTVEQLVGDDGWGIVTLSILDPLSAQFPIIIENRQTLYDAYGNQDVDNYLTYSIRRSAEEIVHPIWEPAAFYKLKDADTRHEALLAVLKETDYPAARQFYYFLSASKMVKEHRWDDLLSEMKYVESLGVMNEKDEYDYYRFNLKPLYRDGGSAEHIKKAVEIINNKIENTTDQQLRNYYYQLRNEVNRPARQ